MISSVACSSPRSIDAPGEAPGGQVLLPLALPDLARVDEAVQAQARERYSALTQKIQARTTPPMELGAAYGELGMVLHAAEYFDAAEPCYLNAQALAPNEVRWPYFLAHLHRAKGASEKAAASFKRVLELRPNDFATLVWLGRLELDQGRPEGAEPLFARALAQMPQSIAALSGLGRAALAKREYAAAANHLEQALAIDPQAESLHAPLAMAYRGLGDLRKAEPHARQWRNRDILLPDPLRQELDLVLQSGLSYELRGVRALEGRDWMSAAGFFRKGLALSRANTPLRRSLQHKLGTALYLAGDSAGALEQFEEVVRLSPATGLDESVAKAHYSIGVIMASTGKDQQAVEHFSTALKYQPNYVEAHLALGDALRRTGRVETSLGHYKEAVTINPRAVDARLGYALALVRLRRYQQARAWLEDSLGRLPDEPHLARALARLLAAAPDSRVRDGERAMTLVQELFKTDKGTDMGETMAMALAELGEYDRAAAIQRGVLEVAQRAGLSSAADRMTSNLRLYERRQPCRTPWAEDDELSPQPGPVGPDFHLSKKTQ